KGEAMVEVAQREFLIKREFLDDLERLSTEEASGHLHKALLILHSPIDEIVGIDNAAGIYDRAKHPKSFVSLDDADHLLSRESDARYAAHTIATWAERYLDRASAGVDPQETAVRLDGRGFQADVLTGGHRLTADEPVSVGGTDEGPAPYDFLLSSLGTCTAMTLRMYADHKKWAMDSVEVRLRHSKVDAKDCVDCESSEGKVDVIERELLFEGDLSADQKARMVEIADKCPVHRTLESETLVRTQLKS
ncbi:MAG: OsmC family protein, partial [Verrucomicrobiota bacterium]